MRKHCRSLWLLGLILAGAGGHCYGQSAFEGSVAVLSAAKHRKPDKRQIANALRLSAAALHVADHPMPRIVLLEAGVEEARVAAVGGLQKVFIEKHPATEETVYLAWFVGEPGTKDLVYLFIAILNEHFGLHLTPADIDGSARRAFLAATTTTSVQSLLKLPTH